MGQYQTFVVRIWTDGAASAPRGHVQHIASRRGKYFRDEGKLIQFIREYLQPAALPITEPDDAPPPTGPATPSLAPGLPSEDGAEDPRSEPA